MKLEHAKLVEENDDHFVVDDGQGPVKVPKWGLAHRTVERIRKHFSEGGEVEPVDKGSDPEYFERFGEPLKSAPKPSALESDPDYIARFGSPAVTEQPPAGYVDSHPDAMLSDQPAPKAETAPPPLPVVPQAPAAPTKVKPGFNADQEIAAGAKQEAAAMQAKGSAEATGLAEQAKIERARATDVEARSQDFQKRYAAEQSQADAKFQEYTKFLSDPKNTINPNRIWNNADGSPDTGKRIQGAIALFLGGLGAGLTKGPNYALQIIDKAIDRDIEAQKDSLTRKTEGLRAGLGYHLGRMKDMQAAYHIEKADGLDKAAAQLNAASFDKASQMARPMVDAAVGQLRQQAASLRQQGVLRGQQIELGNIQLQGAKQQMSMFQSLMAEGRPDLAKGLWLQERMKDGKWGEHTVPFTEERQTPTGQTVEIPRTGWAWNPDVAKEATKNSAQIGSISRNLRALEHLSQANPHGTLSPVQRQIAQQALKSIALEYNSGVAGNNRLNSEEIGLIEGMAKDPTKISLDTLTGASRASLGFMRQGLEARRRELHNLLVPGTIR